MLAMRILNIRHNLIVSHLLQGPDTELDAELFGVIHAAPGEPFLPEEHIKAIASLRKLYLVGLGGSGKSVALATLAHWARTSGWLVGPPSHPWFDISVK